MVVKGRRGVIEQYVDAFLALCGPMVKVTQCAPTSKKKPVVEPERPGRTIRDLICALHGAC